MRRIHRPLRVKVTKTNTLKQVDRSVARHEARQHGELFTGAELLARLRATPAHLRVGEKDMQVGP
jgi:hypothetical protein